jgi:lipoate-protein ligase A
MHHGTLIYDVNIEDMVAALNVSGDKIISKGAKSVRSRVTTIKEHLPNSTTLQDFWNELHYYLSNRNQDDEIKLTARDLEKIEHEARTRFSTWEWNYGYSPEFNYKNSQRFEGGRVEVLIDVSEGKIKGIRFRGDYLGLKDVKEIEQKLIGTPFRRGDVLEILNSFDLKLYLGSITSQEISSLMFY